MPFAGNICFFQLFTKALKGGREPVYKDTLIKTEEYITNC